MTSTGQIISSSDPNYEAFKKSGASAVSSGTKSTKIGNNTFNIDPSKNLVNPGSTFQTYDPKTGKTTYQKAPDIYGGTGPAAITNAPVAGAEGTPFVRQADGSQVPLTPETAFVEDAEGNIVPGATNAETLRQAQELFKDVEIPDVMDSDLLDEEVDLSEVQAQAEADRQTEANKQAQLDRVLASAQQAGMNAKANDAFIQAASMAFRGEPATADELAKVGENQFGLDGASVKDVLGRFGLLDQVPGMGMEEETEVVEGDEVAGIDEEDLKSTDKDDPINNRKKTPLEKMDKLVNKYLENLGIVREEAREDVDLSDKSDDITEKSTNVNTKRTELENLLVNNIADQDKVIRRSGTVGVAQAGLNRLSREQKLDVMIAQNEYNNALVEQQIAQGAYDRAREMVQETVQDWTQAQSLKLDFLSTEMNMQEKEKARLQQEIQFEREMMLEGYTHIPDTETYNKIVKDMGINAGNFSNFIYKDPATGKMYLRPSDDKAVAGGSGGTTRPTDDIPTSNIPTFEEFLSEAENEVQMTFTPEVREELRAAYEEEVANINIPDSLKAENHFTSTQLSKGAGKAGMTITEFGKLHRDEANNYIFGDTSTSDTPEEEDNKLNPYD